VVLLIEYPHSQEASTAKSVSGWCWGRWHIRNSIWRPNAANMGAHTGGND